MPIESCTCRTPSCYLKSDADCHYSDRTANRHNTSNAAIKMKPVIKFFIIVLLSVTTGCDAPQRISGGTMAAANQLYESGQFEQAARQYETLIDSGIQDGHLYYNLGNAYFKMGELGRAILNFRRAQRLLPRDDDVAANLRLARQQTKDRIETEQEETVIRLARRLLSWLTPNEAALIALVLWISISGLSIGAILWSGRRRIFLYLASIVALLLVTVMLSLGTRMLDQRGQPPAVIVINSVAVQSGPSRDYLTEFTLHAGAEVRIVEQREDWARIVLPGELQGWVPVAAIEEV